MENTQNIKKEKQQIKSERLLYQWCEKGTFDHKTDYDKGKKVLENKLEYIPEGDTLTKNESDFIAKNYPEMIKSFSKHFNWKESSSEVIKWGGKDVIKENFKNIDLRQSYDVMVKYEPELYDKIKKELSVKVPIASSEIVPKNQIQRIIDNLREKGFGESDRIIGDLEKAINLKKDITGQLLLDTVSIVDDKKGYLNGIKYNYLVGAQIINQSGLILDEKSITHIKVNDHQNIRLPLMGKGFTDIKGDLDKLLRGEQTKLIEGFKKNRQTFDAKIQLFINPETNKLQIRSRKKSLDLEIPEELTETEMQKLKNGQTIVFSKGFLFNYRNAKDKTSLYLRKIIAERKKSSAKKQEVKAALTLDTELNKLVVNYHIKNEGDKSPEIVATVVANDTGEPTVYLKSDKNIKNNKNYDRVKRRIAGAVSSVKTARNENQLNLDFPLEKPTKQKTKSIKI